MFSNEEIKVTDEIANTTFKNEVKKNLPIFVWLILKTFFPKIVEAFRKTMPEAYDTIETMRQFSKGQGDVN